MIKMVNVEKLVSLVITPLIVNNENIIVLAICIINNTLIHKRLAAKFFISSFTKIS